jgi:hypothetical protein
MGVRWDISTRQDSGQTAPTMGATEDHLKKGHTRSRGHTQTRASTADLFGRAMTIDRSPRKQAKPKDHTREKPIAKQATAYTARDDRELYAERAPAVVQDRIAEDGWMSPHQAATILRKHPVSIYRWVKRGLIKSKRFGKTIVVQLTPVESKRKSK